ncbi:MAG: hypothetical protein B6241_10910 [Spirochaetaceae bacterium 4572_59]|nr:MAG: hypothetical protein B6241_10910 [Spirochaetaceae bacterium 4572_59]
MFTDLSNEMLSLRIYSAGAEMKSLKLKGKEYLWGGSSDSWAGSSPQLFPVVGAMPEAGWEWKGHKLNLGNHGFARTSDFEVIKKNEQEVAFRLRDCAETRKQYPFPFILDISYRLNGNTLTVDYHIENPAEEELLFSIGAHPGFLCPLDEKLEFSDYYLKFNQPEKVFRRLKNDFLTGEKELALDNQDRLDLDFSLFDRGALIFSDLKSDSVTLGSDKSVRSVQMDFNGFPYFGIWTIAGKKAPYVCLEPWYGIDSTEGDSSDFGKKEGLVRLAAGAEFNCYYTLTLS